MDVDQGEVLEGQKFEERLGILLPFTWQKVSPGKYLGQAATDLDVVNKDLNLCRVWDVAAIQASLDAIKLSYPSTTDRVSVPDELEEIKVLWAKSQEDGDFASDYSGEASGPAWSLSGSESANAHGSAAVMPELQVRRKEFWTNDLVVQVYEFYMPENFTMSELKARHHLLYPAITLLDWPVFKPKALSFVLSGGKVSVRVDAQAAAGRSYNQNDEEDPDDNSNMWDRTQGSGASKETNLDVRVINLPPMLFGAQALGQVEESATASASCGVFWIGSNFPSVNVSKTESVTINGEVSPGLIAATSPTVVPKTGHYLVRVQPEPVGWDRIKVRIEVLDASIFA